MAWKRLCYGMRDMPFNYSKFICDDTSDIETLPTNITKATVGDDKATCAIGSEAIVISEKTIYILNTANEWKEFTGVVNRLVSGTHALYFTYTGEGYVDFTAFTLE